MIILNLIRLNVVSRKYFGRALSENKQIRNKRNANHEQRAYYKCRRRKTYERAERYVHNRISRAKKRRNDDKAY